MKVFCNNCRNVSNDEGNNICEHCGTALDDGEGKGAEVYVKESEEAVASNDSVKTEDALDLTDTQVEKETAEDIVQTTVFSNEDTIAASTMQHENLREPVDLTKSEEEASHNGHPDIELLYNNAEISVKGMMQHFSLKLQAVSEELKDVQIFVESSLSSGGMWRRQSNLIKSLYPGCLRQIYVAYEPKHVGFVSFVAYIVYKRNGVLHCLESEEQQLMVYDVSDSAERVVQSLSLNIHNEIKNNTGHANDYNAKNTLDDLDSLRIGLAPDAELKGYIAKIAACGSFCRMSLYETCWNPPVEYGSQYNRVSFERPDVPTGNLTLEINGMLVHLIAGKDVITLGKRRDNDIVTRILNGYTLDELKQCNKYISRRHCRVERNPDDKLEIYDGVDNSSGWHTTVNNKILSFLQPYVVDKKHFELTLASGAPESSYMFSLKCHVHPYKEKVVKEQQLPVYGDNGSDAALSLGRTDDINEIFVIVWSYCNLRDVSRKLSDMVIWYDEGCFGYRRKNEYGCFENNTQLSIGGVDISVSSMQQYGL